MAEAATLYFKANAKNVVQTLNNIQGRLGTMNQKGAAAGQSMQRGFQASAGGASALGTALAGVSFAGFIAGAMKVVGAVRSMGAAMVSAASDVEQQETRFEVLTGSVDAAQAHVAKLREFAKKTPFELSGISKASTTLLAFGVEARESMEVLRMLGDVAAGSGSRIEELAAIYGKVVTAGKMDTMDINQLSTRGLNVRALLAERDSLSAADVQKKVSRGEYNVEDLKYVLQKATGSGGLFEGAMEKLSKTLKGQWDTLKDGLTDLAATLGKHVLPHLSKMVEAGDDLLQKFGQPLESAFLIVADHAKETWQFLKEWSAVVKYVDFGLQKMVEPLREIAKVQLAINQAMDERASWTKELEENRAKNSFDHLALQQERERARLASLRAESEDRAAYAAEKAARAAKAEKETRMEMMRSIGAERAARTVARDKYLFENHSAEGMRAELATRYKAATGEELGYELQESVMRRAENDAAARGDHAALAELRRLRRYEQAYKEQRQREVEERNKRGAEMEAVRRAEVDEANVYDARERGDVAEVQRLEAERAAGEKFDRLMGLGFSQGEAAQIAAAAAGRQFGRSEQTSSPGEWMRDDLAAVGGGGAAIRIPSAQLQVQRQQLTAANLTNQLLTRLLARPNTLPVTP